MVWCSTYQRHKKHVDLAQNALVVLRGDFGDSMGLEEVKGIVGFQLVVIYLLNFLFIHHDGSLTLSYLDVFLPGTALLRVHLC